jgi:hypothetical protein
MGELVYIQPMTLSLSSVDAAIDDSKARKMIGSAFESWFRTSSLADFFLSFFLADTDLNGRRNSVSNIPWMNSSLGGHEVTD